MRILSIQSHVAFGYVGNRSAVFPLERLGYEVMPVNTVQFSCHTGIPGWKGAAFGGDHVLEVVQGLKAIGALNACDAVLSGYMGDVETGRAIIEAVDATKSANPRALFCCDPVMGDVPEGLYVRSGLPEFMAGEAIPRADIVCPNVFEAEILSGMHLDEKPGSDDGVARIADAIHRLGPRVVMITSYRPHGDGRIGFFLSDGAVRTSVLAPILPFPRPPKGSGDLSSALFLGYYLKNRDAPTALEQTMSALYAVLERTLASGRDELAIIECQDSIANPSS